MLKILSKSLCFNILSFGVVDVKDGDAFTLKILFYILIMFNKEIANLFE